MIIEESSQSPRLFGSIDATHYRLMIESVADYAIFLIDSAGFVQSWNAGAEQMNGYRADEIIGLPCSVFYPAELIERDQPEHELRMARTHGRFEAEGWRVRKDGSRFWANVVVTQLIDGNGVLVGFSKIIRDLSGRRGQLDSLRSNEEQFRLLVESVKDYAIFMLDPTGRVMSWNNGAQLAKGYSAGEIIGKHFSIFYPPDVVASGWPQRELELALRDGRLEDEGWRVRKDGSRFWANVVITALHDAGGNHRGFAKVTRDLTEKRKINALEAEGRRITNFLAMLGHELRNPLAPIANALAALSTAGLSVERVHALHEIIDRQVGQMSRLIDDLLDISRIISGKVHLSIEPLPLRNAATAAVEAVAPLMQQKSHRLSVAIDTDAWVKGDYTRLIQIVVNLMTNAAKFTPAGGEIALRVERDGATAKISVADNGPGIPAELLPNIFKLFFQGEQDISRSQGGLGLGLTLVRELVKLHGGEIAVFSPTRQQRGSEFVIHLPIVEAPAQTAESTRATDGGQGQRILVVDDNRDAADTMGLLLEALGYRAEVVYDGAAAIEAAFARKPDLLLLDIGLPNLSGFEVARRIVAHFAEPPPLVAVTGYGQEKDRAASLDAGFYAHLTKPVLLTDLTDLLARLFEARAGSATDADNSF